MTKCKYTKVISLKEVVNSMLTQEGMDDCISQGHDYRIVKEIYINKVR
jgi:hypothetical protein